METVTETPNKWIPSPAVRRYIYSVLAVALPLFGARLGLGHEEIPMWLELAGVILGVAGGGAFGLAAVNTGKPVAINATEVEPELTEAEKRQLEKERLMKLFADVQEQGPIVDVDQFGESARKRSL